MKKMNINIGLFGTAINNGNLGCVALTYSLISILNEIAEERKFDITYYLFDVTPNKKK